MLLDGRPYRPRDPLDARRTGVAMIYQELSLAPHLAVEENIVLGLLPIEPFTSRDVLAIAAVLDSLSPDDQAALLTFSHGLRLGGGLTGDLKRLRGALDEAVPSGDTALYDAAYVAMMLGEQSPGRDLLVVFSDGRDTASWLSADQVVDAARRADVVAYGLALRDPASRRFLRRLADETGGEAIELDSTSNLRARFLSVLEGFRQRYLISYTPSGVTRSGWHRLEVRVAGRRATVRARPGYFER